MVHRSHARNIRDTPSPPANRGKHKSKHFFEIGADHMLCSVCKGETESDLWVECDQCKAWQHQLCCGYFSESDILEQHFCDECSEKQVSEQGSSSNRDEVSQKGDQSHDAHEVEHGVDRWLVYSSQSGLFSAAFTHGVYKCEGLEKQSDAYEWHQGKRKIDVDLILGDDTRQALLFQVGESFLFQTSVMADLLPGGCTRDHANRKTSFVGEADGLQNCFLTDKMTDP
eukprot:122927-Hanusia_phi.AAC.4